MIDRRWLCGLAALLALGCSGDGGSTASEEPVGAVSRDTLSTEFAEWLCDGFETCCDDAGMPFDRSSCLEAQRARELRRWSRDERDEDRQFSESAAARCMDLLRDTPPACDYGQQRVRDCFQLIDGARELGDPCESKSQCRGQREGLVACIDGVCTERGVAGGACVGEPSCDGCQRGSLCRRVEGDEDYRCVPREDRVAGEGESCLDDAGAFGEPLPAGTEVALVVRCAPGLRCGLAGTCRREAAPGEACSSDLDCAGQGECRDGVCGFSFELGDRCESRGCEEGTYCSSSESRCVAFLEAGEPCSSSRDPDRRCGPGLVCQVAEGSSEQRCLPFEAYWCARAS